MVNKRTAVEVFIHKWLNNPAWDSWDPKVKFYEQSEGTRREFYDKGHNHLRAMAWEMFTDVKIGAQARDQMCWIMAVGLWEKQRREKAAEEKLKNENPEEWARRARQRVHDRMAGKVDGMPLTNKDGQTYLNLIDAAPRRTSHWDD